MENQTKTCNKCNLSLSFSEFHKNKKSKDGMHGSCKKCKTIRDNIYYQNNRTRILAKIKVPPPPEGQRRKFPRRLNYNKGDHVGSYLYYLEEAGWNKRGGRQIKATCKYLNCNNTTIAELKSIRDENTLSCGCYAKAMAKAVNQKAKGESGMNAAYAYHKTSAKTQKSSPLPKDVWLKMCQENCYYCNASPSNTAALKSTMSPEGIEWSKFIYNGIDRVDSSKGYEIDNCVPCCFDCNGMKSNRHKNKFLKAIKLAYEHLQLNKVNLKDLED